MITLSGGDGGIDRCSASDGRGAIITTVWLAGPRCTPVTGEKKTAARRRTLPPRRRSSSRSDVKNIGSV